MMMQAVDGFAPAPSPQPVSGTAPIAAAERELGAFLAAVRQQFGPEATERAGMYWIEALEAAGQPCSRNSLRRITILAASRLACDRSVTPPARSARFPA